MSARTGVGEEKKKIKFITKNHGKGDEGQRESEELCHKGEA